MQNDYRWAEDSYRMRYLRMKKVKKCIRYVLVILILVVAYGLVGNYTHKEQMQAPQMTKSHKSLTLREWKFSRYFHKNGSKSPDEMAIAVLKTQSPRLLAKIAVSESNANPHIRKYGWKKMHDGAFGVNRKDWGPVSKDPTLQALQAERALNTFLKEAKLQKKKDHALIVALNGYGGDSSGEYAERQLEGLVHVPK